MTAKISTQKKAELVKRALSGESVSSLSREAGVSRVIFYRWISRYKENGEKGLTEGARGRPAKKKAAVLKKEYTKLSSSARLNMVKEVVEQEQEASEVAERYGISRTTLYKWIKRYEEDVRNGKIPELSSRVPFVEHYYRETPEKYQEAVLSMVARHPEYGIRSIVANLPKVGTTPIVGHHGVQNILRRNGLLHFEQRLAYAKGKETGITYSIGKVLDTVLTFFRIKPETRAKIIESSSTIFLIAFGIMVGLGATAFLAGNIFAPTGVSRVGLVFAGLALIMGSIFFLYSLKYYLTLALVLSYTQKSSLSKNRQESGGEGILSKILGQAHSNDFGYGRQSAGLEPDLSHVTLARNPYISVHIPFYNEKNVVRRSIEAAVNFKYPEYEVILCDDSTDSTTDIIREYMKLYLAKGERLKHVVNEKEGWTLSSVEIKPGVTLKHLHRTTRSGYKGKALALALTLTDPRTEFISIFDADFVPYPDTLELFLKYFKVGNNMNENYGGSNIAAVQGYQWHVLNKSENWITRGVRSEYAGSYVIERSGTEIYGGLKQISGSVYMIRKSTLESIGWGESITEDFELTLKLYEAGYKVLYTPYVQAPAECVSTIKRLIRQRMRWAEGHSFNVKKMFKKLMLSPKLTVPEKLEFAYLSPYYLQAFFFIVGTFSWLLAETVFRARLPFWTELWGWSLVLTNLVALPLVNGVGLFVEESEERDFLGLGSFIALSYLLVPFQAYASVKGLLEDKEGPWFRTPKTGRITDVFARSRFYKFIAGILPGKAVAAQDSAFYTPSPYLAMSSANNRFNSFTIKPIRIKWAAKAVISVLLCFTTTLLYFARNVQVVYATNISGTMIFKPGKFNAAGEAWPTYGNGLQNGASTGTGGSWRFNNGTANVGTNNYTFFSNMLPLSTNGTAIIPGGNYYVNLAKTGGPANANTINYAIQLLLTNNNGSSPNVILSNTAYWTRNNSGTEVGSPISGASGAHNTIFAHLIGNLSGNVSIDGSAQKRLAVRVYITSVTSNTRTTMNIWINNSTLPALLVLPSPIQVPEIPKQIIFVVLVTMMPIIPGIASKLSGDQKKKRKGGKKTGGPGDNFGYFLDKLTGAGEISLDAFPV